jgi:hypothetical protein
MRKTLRRWFGSDHEKDLIKGTDCFTRKMKTLTPPVSDALTRRVVDCCDRSVLAPGAVTG